MLGVWATARRRRSSELVDFDGRQLHLPLPLPFLPFLRDEPLFTSPTFTFPSIGPVSLGRTRFSTLPRSGSLRNVSSLSSSTSPSFALLPSILRRSLCYPPYLFKQHQTPRSSRRPHRSSEHSSNPARRPFQPSSDPLDINLLLLVPCSVDVPSRSLHPSLPHPSDRILRWIPQLFSQSHPLPRFLIHDNHNKLQLISHRPILLLDPLPNPFFLKNTLLLRLALSLMRFCKPSTTSRSDGQDGEMSDVWSLKGSVHRGSSILKTELNSFLDLLLYSSSSSTTAAERRLNFYGRDRLSNLHLPQPSFTQGVRDLLVSPSLSLELDAVRSVDSSIRRRRFHTVNNSRRSREAQYGAAELQERWGEGVLQVAQTSAG